MKYQICSLSQNVLLSGQLVFCCRAISVPLWTLIHAMVLQKRTWYGQQLSHEQNDYPKVFRRQGWFKKTEEEMGLSSVWAGYCSTLLQNVLKKLFLGSIGISIKQGSVWDGHSSGKMFSLRKMFQSDPIWFTWQRGKQGSVWDGNSLKTRYQNS